MNFILLNSHSILYRVAENIRVDWMYRRYKKKETRSELIKDQKYDSRNNKKKRDKTE